MNNLSNLIEVLKHKPHSKKISQLITSVEKDSYVDIEKQIDKFTGVWELRWSSSRSPLLNYSPLLDNLQILEPEKSRCLNLIRPKFFFGKLFSANILANLEIIDQKRIDVIFKKVGVLGPYIFGKNISFLSKIKKTQRGWLDTTVITSRLRISRGYKGTTFALLKRNDLSINEFFKFYPEL